MFRLILIAALINVHTPLQWLDTVPDDAVIDTCLGNNIELLWNYTLPVGETVEDIRWLFQKEGLAEEFIAISAAGIFNPMPAFSGRVQQKGEAGIVISQAAPLESGNYTVVVSTADEAKPLVRFQRTVYVQVVEPPKTEDGSLHVQQDADAVYDNVTGQWRVQLTCGVFSNLGKPSVQLVWMSPEGQQLPSSRAENGTFHLLLSNPPSGGNYTCTLPSLSPATHCLPPLSPLLGGATVAVDQVKASFTLLLEMQRQLKVENDRLKADFDALKNVTGYEQRQLKAENELLKAEVDALKNETNNAAQRRIGFHGVLAQELDGFSGRLQPFTIITNDGNAFSGTTGLFTTPRNGIYFFVGSAGVTGTGNWVDMALKKEGAIVARAYSRSDYYNSMGTCHAVLNLTVGERVWLESMASNTHYYNEDTLFSGFFINGGD